MRIDGWKAIANYLGRDRSTVMRWAVERAMPVHRIPGGQRGSVFALSEELDGWLAASDDQTGSATVAAADDDARLAKPPANLRDGGSVWQFVKRRIPSRAIWLAVPASLALGLAALAVQNPPEEAPVHILPKDKATAALFLDARADWARRDAASISAAIGKLQDVVAREPGFAPAYAALADCYVLAYEFGSEEPAVAFGRAQDAVDEALRIDPANAAGRRAKGFVDYWWRRDPLSARQSFEASLAREPDNAQTHFWYGNALIDNGDFADGLEHLDKARLLEPVSAALQADYAWALWSARGEGRSLALLEKLRDSNPNLATIRDYLAVLYLAKADTRAFVTETAALARIKGDPKAMAQADALAEALPGGPSAVLGLYVDQTMADFSTGERKTLVWPVFVASMANDRDTVLRLLRMADRRKEVWGSAGLVRQIERRWRGDGAITGLLAPRRPPSMADRAS